MHHEPCSVAVGDLRHRVRVGGAVVDDHHRDDRRKGAQQQVERGGPVLHRYDDRDVVDVGVRGRRVRPPRVGEATVEQQPDDPAHQRPVTHPAGQRRDDPGGLRREEQHRARRTPDEGASVVADPGAVGQPGTEAVRQPRSTGRGTGRARSGAGTASVSAGDGVPLAGVEATVGPTPSPAISRTTRVTICSSRRRPSSALAPVGSPSTPLPDTARTPSARRAGISSWIGVVVPGASRSTRTVQGARNWSSEVSVRPACASAPGTEQSVQDTGRPSPRSCSTAVRTGSALPP